MIAIVGVPWLLRGPAGSTAGGLAARVAVAAARAGSAVQLVGKVGDDAAGDELLLVLAAAGVGHVAVLRPPSTATPVGVARSDEPADGKDPLAVAASLEAPTPAATPPRSAGLTLDAGDLELGFRYLVEFRAIVLAEPLHAAATRVVADAAAFAGAEIVVVVPPGGAPPPDLDRATVLTVDDDDPDGSFADLVGRFAAGLDRGEDPPDALRAAVDATGSAPVGA